MLIRRLLILFLLALACSFVAAQCTPSSTVPSIKVCTPVNGATVSSPVQVTAATNDTHSISAIEIFIDSQSTAVFKQTGVTSINTSISVPTGQHILRVKAWDSVGTLMEQDVTVNVVAGVTVTISPTSATLIPGGTQQFTATVSGSSNTGVTWSVDGVSGGNSTVGTISSTGLYTAPSTTGSHTVTATSVADTTKSASASVNVAASSTCTPSSTVPSIKVCTPTNGATVSSPVQVTATTNDTHSISAIEIFIDSQSTAVFKQTGVTSINTSVSVPTGQHILRVKAWDSVGTLMEQDVTVNVVAGVTVTISPASATLIPGGTQQFTATVSGSSNTGVTWSVDGVNGGNSTVGTISSTGLYTAPSTTGSHTVKATSVADTTKSASASVTVAAPGAITVTVSPKTATVTELQTVDFNATVTNTTNTAVTWQVDGITGGNSTVGTIDASGVYSAPQATGSHQITAVSQADPTKSGSATVFVVKSAGVFTYHNDNALTSGNNSETVLTTSNVNVNQFGKVFSRSVDGYITAQPLYVSNVDIPGLGTFNVVYVATEHDSVYAFDAAGARTSPLWHVSFINPGAGITTVASTDVNSADVGPEIGVEGTPVIDPVSGTMYLVARTKENNVFFQRLHALDITTGAERSGSPVVIKATVKGTGTGGDGFGNINFDPLIENQRPALLLANGNAYIAWASHGDHGNYHGWVMGYNASSLSQVAVVNVTRDGSKGGIWQSGAGLAADSSGNIFFETGNGTFDGTNDFGDSFLKYNPDLTLADFFAPFNQGSLNSGDIDLGASGCFLAPDQSGTIHTHAVIGSGKAGDIYVVDRDNMGHFQSSSNSQIVQYLPKALGHNTTNVNEQFYGIPAYFNGNVYFVGNFDTLKQFKLSSGLLSTTPVAQSSMTLATARGAGISISSDGSSNGIIWVVATNLSGPTAILHAFDATNVAHELWNSNMNSTRDHAASVVKFSTATVVNGKVFLGTKTELDVYGLLP